MESFKKSDKSICHECPNFGERCDYRTNRVCGSDRKKKVAYVNQCDHFDKPFKGSFQSGGIIPGGSISDRGDVVAMSPGEFIHQTEQQKKNLDEAMGEIEEIDDFNDLRYPDDSDDE